MRTRAILIKQHSEHASANRQTQYAKLHLIIFKCAPELILVLNSGMAKIIQFHYLPSHLITQMNVNLDF